jgi:protein-tyrosine phosphatase
MLSSNPQELQRHLYLEGTYNVRDIGGYMTATGRITRWRTLFRADSLHRLSVQGQQTLLAHGVRTVVDLRRAHEVEAAVNVFTSSSQVTYRHISLLTETRLAGDPLPPMPDVYRLMLDERQAQIGEALRTLAAPGGLPAVIHCTAGKDRTGLIVALLLGLVGVPAPTIAADYALSAQYLVGTYLDEARRRAEANGYTWESYQLRSVCLPEYMLATFSHLDQRYGGIAAYMRAVGLQEDEMQRLQDALVE